MLACLLAVCTFTSHPIAALGRLSGGSAQGGGVHTNLHYFVICNNTKQFDFLRLRSCITMTSQNAQNCGGQKQFNRFTQIIYITMRSAVVQGGSFVFGATAPPPSGPRPPHSLGF